MFSNNSFEIKVVLLHCVKTSKKRFQQRCSYDCSALANCTTVDLQFSGDEVFRVTTYRPGRGHIVETAQLQFVPLCSFMNQIL